MQSIDLTEVISKRPFFKEKRRRFGLWTTLLVSNAFWCMVCAALFLSTFTLTKFGKVAMDKFVEQRAKMMEMEAAKAQALAERDMKIANLLKFESSSATDMLTMARTINTIFQTASNSAQEHFFEQALPEALRIQITEGIPASAVMAQAILESSYGQSRLSKTYHNYFGLKAYNSSWKGPKAENMPTLENGIVPMLADFRAYGSLSEGFDGYVAFLKAGSRYDNAFSKKTGIEFITTVINDGYCGDPRYLTMIKQIIERHKLDKLDDIYASQTAKTTVMAKNSDAHDLVR